MFTNIKLELFFVFLSNTDTLRVYPYERRQRTKPRRMIGCLPHLTVRKPKSPKRRPPTTSPAAIRIALMDASAVLFSPNLS